LRELLELLDVARHRLRERAELDRQNVGVREPKDEPAAGLRKRRAVLESRIDEAREVIERIVDRVIRAAAALAAVTDVHRCDAEVLEEGRVVGAGAERGETNQIALPRLLAHLRRRGEGLL